MRDRKSDRSEDEAKDSQELTSRHFSHTVTAPSQLQLGSPGTCRKQEKDCKCDKDGRSHHEHRHSHKKAMKLRR